MISRALALVLAHALVLGAGATASGAAPRAAAGAPDRIKIVYRNEVTSIDVMIAIDEGYFAAEGIEVESVSWQDQEALLPALAQGKVDVLITGSFGPGQVNVIKRGARVRLVRARSIHARSGCSYTAYVARPELIESGRFAGIATLRGLRISTDRTSTSLYLWERLLAQGGLTLDDVAVVDIPTRMRGLALDRKLVDVVSLTEPLVHNAVVAGHGKVWRGVAEVVPGLQKTFMMYGPRLLVENRDLGVRVMRAISRATGQFLEGKSDRNVAIVARHTHVEPAEVRVLCWPQWSADGRIDPGSLADVQQWALRKGLIDGVLPASELIDEGFLDAMPSPSVATAQAPGDPP